MPGRRSRISLSDELPLSDGKVYLRQCRESDIPDLLRGFRNPRIQALYYSPLPSDAEAAKRWVERRRRRFEAGKRASLAVRAVEGDTFLGLTGLVIHSVRYRRAEVGAWFMRDVLEPAEMKLLVERHCRLVFGWAFHTLGLKRLEASVNAENAAGLRWAEQCGFIREGVLRSFREYKSARVDVVLFGLLPSDFAAYQARRGELPASHSI